MKEKITAYPLYSKIAQLIQASRQNAVRVINQTMVYTYFEIGWMIVEDEQQGEERAAYGKQVLKDLSKKHTSDFGKGFSERNLEQMRQFYLSYSIPQTASAKLQNFEDTAVSLTETPLQKSDNSEKTNNSIQQTDSAKLKIPHFQLS
jgi:hypothetical protein